MRFSISIVTALLAYAASALPTQEANKIEKRCCTHTDQLLCNFAAALNPECRNSPSCINEMEQSCCRTLPLKSLI